MHGLNKLITLCDSVLRLSCARHMVVPAGTEIMQLLQFYDVLIRQLIAIDTALAAANQKLTIFSAGGDAATIGDFDVTDIVTVIRCPKGNHITSG